MAQGGFDMGRMSMGTKGLVVTGAVLIISLFLPWQSVGLGPFGSVNRSGFNGLGVLVFLLALAVIAWELALAVTTINTGTVSPALISAGLGAATVLFAVILFLTRLDAISFGAFIGLIAALGMAYATWVRWGESKTPAGGGAPPPPPPTPPAKTDRPNRKARGRRPGPSS